MEIRWTENASDCLENIFNYIQQHNQDAALNTIIGIKEKTKILKTHPQIGYEHKKADDKIVYIILFSHYRIVYDLLEDVIEILGIFHGSMDIQNHL